MPKINSRPPTDFLDRARSLVLAMRANDIDKLPDGTTVDQLEQLIQDSMGLSAEIEMIEETLKRKMEERDKLSQEIWKVTKGGIAHIESRFGDDAVQLEQVGRKRRSKYAKPTRTKGRQTQAATGSNRRQKAKATHTELNTDLPETIPVALTNGKPS